MSRVTYVADLANVEWVLSEPCVCTSGYGRPPLQPAAGAIDSQSVRTGKRGAATAARRAGK